MSKKRAKSKTDAGSRGVGRPATHPEGITRIVSATLPSEQVKDLDLIADQKGRSRSKIISGPADSIWYRARIGNFIVNKSNITRTRHLFPATTKGGLRATSPCNSHDPLD